MGGQYPPGRLEHVDHRSRAALAVAGGGDDQSFGGARHAVHAARVGEVVQYAAVAHAAVGGERIGAQLAPLIHPMRTLGDVQLAFVGVQQHTVGPVGVECHPPWRAASVDAVDRLVVELHRAPAVVGVTEPDAPAGGLREVVGLVELPALEAVGDNFGGRGRNVTHDPAAATLARQQAAARRAQHAVGTPGVLAPHRPLAAAGVVAPRAAGADLGVEQAASIPHRPLGDVLVMVDQFPVPVHCVNSSLRPAAGWMTAAARRRTISCSIACG